MLWRAVSVLTLLALVATFGSCSSERRDWRSAQAADTVESYGRFLAEHPEGTLADDARARIAELNEEHDWKRATQIDTAAAYERFLTQHPQGRWAQEARIRAETFVLSDADEKPLAAATGGFGVQLGAFASETNARVAWEQLAARFPAELQGRSAEIAPASSREGTIYRLHVRVADEGAARALCARLREREQPCVPVLPAND